MNRIFIILTFLAFYTQVNAQTFLWAKNVNTFTTQGLKIINDQSGNIISTGTLLGGTVDFDFGPGVFNLTPGVGNSNAYIAKYNTDGDFIWAKLIFSQYANNRIIDLKVDSNNNVYLLGAYNGTIDFDPGPGAFYMTNANQNNLDALFIEKLDSNGNFIWAKQITDSIGYASNPSFWLNQDAALLITGYFNGTVDFDPNNGVQQMTANVDNTFLLKLNANGEYVWSKQIEGSVNNGVRTIVDFQHNIYLIGKFMNTIDADPDAGIYYLTGTSDINLYMIKLNATGNFKWAKSISALNLNSNIAISDLQADKFGNIYYGGYYADSVDFDLGVTNDIRASNGATDIFFSKVDSSGQYQWTRTFGGTSTETLNQIASDSFGNFYLIGLYYSNLVDFNPDNNAIYTLTGGRSFVSKFDANGVFINAKSFGNNNTGYIIQKSISIDFNNHIFCTGYFQGTQDFDPGAAVYDLTTPVSQSMYIEKFRFCGTYYDTTITHCHSLNLWGTQYDSSTQFVQMFSDINQCDSNISVQLTITHNGAVNIAKIGDTLQVFPLGFSYQWFDCETNMPISGATDAQFIPNESGSYYAVVYFNPSCSDTTLCDTTYITNTSNVDENFNFKIRPNPSYGYFDIIQQHHHGIYSIKISDIYGNLIFQKIAISNPQVHIDLSSSPSGMYILEIKTENQNQLFKLLKL